MLKLVDMILVPKHVQMRWSRFTRTMLLPTAVSHVGVMHYVKDAQCT